MQYELNESIKYLKKMENIEINTCCISLFKDDGKFYRATILAKDDVKSIAKVYYSDYGNFDYVSYEK